MFDQFIANLNSGATFVTDMIICLVLVLAASVFIVINFRKIPAAYAVVGLLIISALCFVFGFTLTGLIFSFALLTAVVIFVYANISDLRKYFIKPQSFNKKGGSNYDKDALYHVIDDTVHSLSRTKTGAIMTFERSTNLDDVMKSGTIINAPVTQEIIETIFYEGTRLHDGAIIIRGNMIVAAAVYYTPTTRALTGKFGARHRAAFGISEISDSVTVVVSEETGRVAIAHNGTLEPVPLDTFLREFSDLMSSEN